MDLVEQTIKCMEDLQYELYAACLQQKNENMESILDFMRISLRQESESLKKRKEMIRRACEI